MYLEVNRHGEESIAALSITHMVIYTLLYLNIYSHFCTLKTLDRIRLRGSAPTWDKCSESSSLSGNWKARSSRDEKSREGMN